MYNHRIPHFELNSFHSPPNTVRKYVIMSSNPKNVRWIDLSDDQKKDVLRKRNADSARKFRQNKKVEEERIDKIYKSNEKRMDRLDRAVHSLTQEAEDQSRNLRRMATSVAPKKTSTDCSKRTDSSALSRGTTFHGSHPAESSRSSKSTNRGNKKSAFPNGKSSHHSGKDEERPSWFGDAF